VDLPEPASVLAGPLYDALRRVNPSPFSALLRFDDLALVSSSPERLVRLQGSRAETRPIAGTHGRGLSAAADHAVATQLLGNTKERAEHLMLVDLERNDLGRVCRYGSIHVDEFMTVERYSHVSHLVSNVTGELRTGLDAFDLIRATFPGGTITGVPKVHCMEIIDQLEPVRRGPYTGSLGYLNWDGGLDLNILIRTLVLQQSRGFLQVGAGIVADSDAHREYDETMLKAGALIEALKGI
jgi:anthranilate/para-aminobenzoate synthase component I